MKFFDTETFWGRVRQKAFDNGMTIKTLSERIGEPYKSMTNRISNNTVPKKAGLIAAMARELGCTAEYLTTGKESPDDHKYGPEIQALIVKFLCINEEKRRLVFALLDALIKEQEIEDDKFKKRHPELFR